MNADELEVDLVGGAGNHEEYQRILRLAEESRYPVHLLGRLSQADLVAPYNRSDLFVLASYSEGLPLTIIEAMACGCKVIVTDLPGHPSLGKCKCGECSDIISGAAGDGEYG